MIARVRSLALLVLVTSVAVAQAPARPAGRIILEPQGPVVLGDETRIRLADLVPGELYGLTADIVDEVGRRWRSSATFIAGIDGTVNLDRDAPVRGTYTGADPLGLFWSAAQRPGGSPSTAMVDSSVVALTLRYRGVAADSVGQVRWLLRPGATVTEVRERGVVGAMYRPPSSLGRRPLVVLLGGSGGGIGLRPAAAVLASQGYNALALAYFGIAPLPGNLESIPLEYFRTAIRLASGMADVDSSKVAIIGLSRGAEAALLAAAYLPEIRAVIAFAPTAVAFQGSRPPDFPVVPSWTWQGAPIPAVPNHEAEPFRASDRESERAARYMLYNLETTVAATIPVERIRGPVLLISGRDDTIWPSPLMSQQITQRLERSAFAFSYQSIVYDSVGHAFARPGYGPTSTISAEGVSPRAHAYAQRSSWQRVLAFLGEWSRR